jgi:hypothetical protein
LKFNSIKEKDAIRLSIQQNRAKLQQNLLKNLVVGAASNGGSESNGRLQSEQRYLEVLKQKEKLLNQQQAKKLQPCTKGNISNKENNMNYLNENSFNGVSVNSQQYPASGSHNKSLSSLYEPPQSTSRGKSQENDNMKKMKDFLSKQSSCCSSNQNSGTAQQPHAHSKIRFLNPKNVINPPTDRNCDLGAEEESLARKMSSVIQESKQESSNCHKRNASVNSSQPGEKHIRYIFSILLSISMFRKKVLKLALRRF